jgi:hypothetical protein
MAQSLDLYIDTSSGALLARGAAKNGTLPTLTRNDSYNLRVRLQERDQSGFLRDLDTSGIALKLGIGGVDDRPSDGEFKLTLSATTSTAISFNATTTQVYNAISAIAGSGVAVATFGSVTVGEYLITAMTANTALSFGGDAFTLFPTSSVLVSTRRFPAASVKAQQIIKLVRNPAVFADTFAASSTAGVVGLTTLQEGSAVSGLNEIYNLSIGPDAEGGSIVLNYGANSTTAIAIGSSAISFNEALSAVTGIGSGNISVDSGNNSGNYTISFVRELGQQNITTAFTLDASGVVYGRFLTSTVTMSTAELDELFAEAGADTITPTIEVELTQNGSPKTILQDTITVRRDLITTGSAVPAAQAQYYTKAETDALFVEDSATNVDATNRKLYNSGGSVFLDWQNNTIGTGATVLDLSGTAVTITDGYNLGLGTTTGTKFGVATSSKLAFYGSTAITQPANINVVSGLINVGLIANGATYGVLPQSPRTLTTLTSVTFGTVAGNDQHYRDVVVTGAAVNDIVLVGLPSAVSSGIVIQGVVYQTNTVCLSATHADTGSVDLNTATYRITVIGY